MKGRTRRRGRNTLRYPTTPKACFTSSPVVIPCAGLHFVALGEAQPCADHQRHVIGVRHERTRPLHRRALRHQAQRRSARTPPWRERTRSARRHDLPQRERLLQRVKRPGFNDVRPSADSDRTRRALRDGTGCRRAARGRRTISWAPVPSCVPPPLFIFSATGGVRFEPVPWLGFSAALLLGVDSYPNPFGMVELGVTFVLPWSTDPRS